MNWDQIEGKWTQLTGSAKKQWGKLTDDDLKIITGGRDQVVGKLQERYGIAKEEAERRADEWARGASTETVTEETTTTTTRR
jgi:uncharacterized protein YjbJ (UPF0337 family)